MVRLVFHLNVSGFQEFSGSSENSEKGKVEKKKKKSRCRSFCWDKGENHNNIQQLDKFFRKAISFWGDGIRKKRNGENNNSKRKLSSTVTFFFFTGCPDLPDKDLPKALRHIVIPFIFELYGTLLTILLPYIIIIPPTNIFDVLFFLLAVSIFSASLRRWMDIGDESLFFFSLSLSETSPFFFVLFLSTHWILLHISYSAERDLFPHRDPQPARELYAVPYSI